MPEMEINRKYSRVVIPIIILFIGISCTFNPFFKDENIETMKISGQIGLVDNVSPEGVYIWLEGFNLSETTDMEGNFAMTLPSPEAQGLGSDFSGKLAIFFYLANYRIDSTTILFANGRLLTDQSNIDNNGKIIDKIILTNLINIETLIEPEIIDFRENNTFHITIILKAFQETVSVGSLRELLLPGSGFIRTGLIIEPFDNPDANTIFIDRPESFLWNDVLFANTEQTWVLNISVNPDAFTKGEYRVVPYILVRQDGIPEGLINSISHHVEEFCADYLKLPMKRIDGSFEVQAVGK